VHSVYSAVTQGVRVSYIPAHDKTAKLDGQKRPARRSSRGCRQALTPADQQDSQGVDQCVTRHRAQAGAAHGHQVVALHQRRGTAFPPEGEAVSPQPFIGQFTNGHCSHMPASNVRAWSRAVSVAKLNPFIGGSFGAGPNFLRYAPTSMASQYSLPADARAISSPIVCNTSAALICGSRFLSTIFMPPAMELCAQRTPMCEIDHSLAVGGR
jgi:hypothetical protein